METLELLAVALGLAALAGVNLYLTVFATGLAVHFQWIHLAPQYSGLEVLGHPVLLALSGTLYALEFFADKIQWVDSLWDAVHTVIRPVGATFVALRVLGTPDPVFDVAVGLLAGSIALGTHSLKAGTRVVVNSSPEPFSNVAVSLTEDAAVLGGLWLVHTNPIVALVIIILLLSAAAWYAPKLFRAARLKLWLMWRKLTGPAADKVPAELPSRLPPDADIALGRLNPGHAGIEWAVPCAVGRARGLTGGVFGWLVATADPGGGLHFVARRRGGKPAATVPIDGHKVSHEAGFLSENLAIYSADGKSRALFLFDRSSAVLVHKAAEWVGRRAGGAVAAPAPREEALAV
jgi:hypothetical protein